MNGPLLFLSYEQNKSLLPLKIYQVQLHDIFSFSVLSFAPLEFLCPGNASQISKNES